MSGAQNSELRGTFGKGWDISGFSIVTEGSFSRTVDSMTTVPSHCVDSVKRLIQEQVVLNKLSNLQFWRVW